MLYFAYGSNMSRTRLINRVPSANFLTVAILKKHKLMFHKSSKDGSAKCDAYQTNNILDYVIGIVYEIVEHEKKILDRIEGLGSGYDEKTVSISNLDDNKELSVVTYFATDIDNSLKPYHWYKKHVIKGAKDWKLPNDYINIIDSVESIDDLNQARNEREMSIYT